MTYITSGLIAIIAVEIFSQIPIGKPLYKLFLLAKKAPAIILSKHISDHWKEIVLQRYARDMAVNSIVAFSWLMIALISNFH